MGTKHTTPAAGYLTKSWFAIAGLVLTSALHVSASDIAPAGDEHLRLTAEEAVRTNPFLGVFDHVVVEVDGGHVRLSGSVEQRQRRELAATSVARLAGVLEVRNDIEVQSSAPEDVMLRRRLFERLYYGGGVEASQRPEWPVRILVSEGHVTLAGELGGNANREQLETMAWSAGARSVGTKLQASTSLTQTASARR